MSKYAIQVENLGKDYIIGGAEQRHDSFREMLTGALTSPLKKLRKLGGVASEEERFWALKDVSFNVEQGEVLGIIGRNGAGKSTLLKVLSRITSPTAGRVVTRGRVASLLEVGTGFHAELSGRENIYLNGAILGMSRTEIGKCFESIVAFAEIDKFLDTPVKRYSSGMYVRLAFAVAAHLNSEILVVDEVLAVGDQEFQKRCLGKMSDIASAGRTVIFVSHNMNAVRLLCPRAIVLKDGRLEHDGPAGSTIETYLSTSKHNRDIEAIPKLNGPLAKDVDFLSISIGNSEKEQLPITGNSPIRIELVGESQREFSDLRVGIGISSRGLRVCTAHDSSFGSPLRPGRFKSVFEIAPGQLRPGRYELSFGAIRKGKAEWCWVENAVTFDIEDCVAIEEGEHERGIVHLNYECKRIQD